MAENVERRLLREAASRLDADGDADLLARIGSALDDEPDVPRAGVHDMVVRWRANMSKVREGVAKKLQSQRDSFSHWSRNVPGLADRPGDDGRASAMKAYARREMEQAAAHASDMVTHLERRLARLDGMLLCSDRELARHLLPLGTVVRFAEAAMERRFRFVGSLPKVGTLGVVSGYAIEGESPLAVSITKHVVDVAGGNLLFDARKPLDFLLACDQFDVVGLGVFPGSGLPNRQAGYVRTHAGDVEGKPDEMLLEAQGHVWRIAEVDGVPTCVGAVRDEAECTWLTRVDEEAPTPGM